MSRQHAVAADHVFDGERLHRNAAVLIEDEQIIAVVPRADLPRECPVQVMPAEIWLAPGFVDLQVNGGGDVLFNDAPTPETISLIAAAHRKFGTTSLLPTLITDTPAKMRAAFAAVQAAIDETPALLGIHFEGPFLSPEKPGVHAKRLIRGPTDEDIELLTAPRKAAMLVTLAPERVPAGFVARLLRSSVRVSLGHSAATYAQTRAAMAEGLSGFTHLFNAMPPVLAREPGPIAAALETEHACYGLIADGIHVAPGALRLALRGAGRPMLVSDAMPPVGGSRCEFYLYGERITATNGRCTRADGTLAGTVLTMIQAVGYCVRELGLSLQEALRLASTYPAVFIGYGHLLGKLAAGFRADLVAFDPSNFQALATWSAGRLLVDRS